MPNIEGSAIDLIEVKTCTDGATKYLCGLNDGNVVESVILEHENMVCACISCQVGCSLGCVFCATAKLGFTRNLNCGEMVGQVLFLSDELQKRGPGRHADRILFMGMGEPLLNYDSVIEAVSLLGTGQHFGSPEVFLATSGIPSDHIRRLARDRPFVRLWVSLCGADDETRVKLMPASLCSPIVTLLDAASYYGETTGLPVRLNYLMLDKVNDSLACARRLVSLLRGKQIVLQLSRLNPGVQLELRCSQEKRTHRFAEYCASRGITTTVFESKGSEIAAGCGQLAGRWNS